MWGKPAGKKNFTTPSYTDRVIWEKAITGIGDPWLRVENLGG